jgi:hypothetical protein
MIYIRTGKGDEEVGARRPGLGARLNSVLFLVDGKRTSDEINVLVARLGNAPDSLDQLVEGGYVQLMEKPPVLRAAPDIAATSHDGHSVHGGHSIPATASILPTHSMADSALQSALYQHLIAAAKQYLGMRGFLFHLKIEKAVDVTELRALITPMGEAIAKSKGLATANTFIEETQALVQPAV